MAEYIPSKTMINFHKDETFVRALMGPIGSGKSVACCMEVLAKAHMQKPNVLGIRKTRWVIIRNTYRELTDTTMATFFDWFPKDLGEFRQIDAKWTLTGKLEDGTKLHLEVLFRALDKPSDVKKLLSLEVTGAWVNEAREIPKEILDMLIGRLGRYPSKRDGGATWYGVIMDTNPPDEDHWWYRLFEETQPNNYRLFRQPSGTSPEAENLENLPKQYYSKMRSGKDPEWINVYVHGNYGFIQDGKVIFPEYNDQLHCVHDLGLSEGTKVIKIGVDFGLTPAAVVAQIAPDGQVQCLDEVVTEDMGAIRFGERVKNLISSNYDSLPMDGWGDPAGDQRSQVDERTPFLVLRAAGVPLIPAPTNDFQLRREGVAKLLTTLTMSGRPMLVVSPKCRMLRKALAGGYKYRRINASGSERYAEKPDKNMYSHVAEALQYLCVGLGYGHDIIRGKEFGNRQMLSSVGMEYDPI
jgi:PBSX family phage terminase large subunit